MRRFWRYSEEWLRRPVDGPPPFPDMSEITPAQCVEAVDYCLNGGGAIELYLDEEPNDEGVPLVGLHFNANGYNGYGLGSFEPADIAIRTEMMARFCGGSRRRNVPPGVEKYTGAGSLRAAVADGTLEALFAAAVAPVAPTPAE